MDQPDIISLENQAIQASLNNDWNRAIELNQEIIALSPKNLAALNRLGIAYIKTSKPVLAKKTFKEALKISPANPIAAKNLSKLKHQQLKAGQNNKTDATLKHQTVSFIEEPGISRIVPLIKPGDPQIIAGLEIGQPLTLKSSTRKIKVMVKNTNEYIGRLPDNLSLNLSKLMKLGYKYQVFLKSANPQSPQVFIKETKRSKRLKGIPSFPINKNGKKIVTFPKGKPINPPLQIFDPLTKED